MDTIKKFLSIKYLLAVIIIAALLFFMFKIMGINNGLKEIKQAQKQTDTSISQVQTLIASQDKTVERIYSTTIREVQKTNVDIQKHVQNLDADTVVVELNTLLDRYRSERRGD